jgi:hypothetical protein
MSINRFEDSFHAMWIARPIYELLPYVYMVVGVALLGVAWFTEMETLPGILLVVGSLSLLAGIVLWLRRKDYRTRQAEYTNRSLDD